MKADRGPLRSARRRPGEWAAGSSARVPRARLTASGVCWARRRSARWGRGNAVRASPAAGGPGGEKRWSIREWHAKVFDRLRSTLVHYGRKQGTKLSWPAQPSIRPTPKHTNSFVRSFVRSSVRPSVHSSVRSFFRSLITFTPTQVRVDRSPILNLGCYSPHPRPPLPWSPRHGPWQCGNRSRAPRSASVALATLWELRRPSWGLPRSTPWARRKQR